MAAGYSLVISTFKTDGILRPLDGFLAGGVQCEHVGREGGLDLGRVGNRIVELRDRRVGATEHLREPVGIVRAGHP